MWTFTEFSVNLHGLIWWSTTSCSWFGTDSKELPSVYISNISDSSEIEVHEGILLYPFFQLRLSLYCLSHSAAIQPCCVWVGHSIISPYVSSKVRRQDPTSNPLFFAWSYIERYFRRSYRLI
jgi:hypothetical protein